MYGMTLRLYSLCMMYHFVISNHKIDLVHITSGFTPEITILIIIKNKDYIVFELLKINSENFYCVIKSNPNVICCKYLIILAIN